MTDENLDDDLQDLLNQLDDQDEFLSAPEEPPEKAPESEPESEVSKEEIISKKETPPASEGNGKPKAPITGDEVALRPIDELAVTDSRRLDSAQPTLIVASDGDNAQQDLKKYLEQMDGVSKEVLQACQSDRQETQDLINMLRGQIDNAHNKSAAPPRMYIDGLVKAVEVKSNINATAVKVMEGVAKMLAATKAGTTVQNTNVTITGGELDDMLSQDTQDDLD